MMLKLYIQQLQDIVKKNPKAAYLECIAPDDDERNSFSLVVFSPTMGFHDDDGGYIYDGSEDSYAEPNRICIN